jgi:hypothetical protein
MWRRRIYDGLNGCDVTLVKKGSYRHWRLQNLLLKTSKVIPKTYTKPTAEDVKGISEEGYKKTDGRRQRYFRRFVLKKQMPKTKDIILEDSKKLAKSDSKDAVTVNTSSTGSVYCFRNKFKSPRRKIIKRYHVSWLISVTLLVCISQTALQYISFLSIYSYFAKKITPGKWIYRRCGFKTNAQESIIEREVSKSEHKKNKWLVDTF